MFVCQFAGVLLMKLQLRKNTHLFYSSLCLTSLTCCWGSIWQLGTQRDLRQRKRNQKPLSPASPHMNFALRHFLRHKQTMIRTYSIPSLVTCLYQLSCLKCVSVGIRVCVCTWLQRILNVKHRGSVPIQHAFLDFILGHV